MKSRVVLGVLLSGAVLLGVLAGAALRPGSPSASPRAERAGDGEARTTAITTGGARPTVDSARDAALAYASVSQLWLYLDDDALGEACARSRRRLPRTGLSARPSARSAWPAMRSSTRRGPCGGSSGRSQAE